MKRKELYIAALLLFILVGVDQGTKQLAIATLTDGNIEVIPNFFYLKLYYNTGAAFSILENARFLFVGITALVLVYGWKYYKEYAPLSKWFYYGGILFFAGTIGNFIDRLFFGKVTDFLSFIFGSYNFAIFNIADALLTISVPVLIIGLYIYEKQIEEEQTNA